MECQKCKFQNPDGIKFCGECGNKFEYECPKCHSMNPASFKFCGECGEKILPASEASSKELSPDDKLDKIQRYLPKGLAKKILAKREKIEGEKKLVTVMFCDLEGFTPLVEKLEPEKAYDIMDQVYEILIHKVHDFDGTVNEMTGDGVMALFGAPIAIEDAPQRAIRSSISIHKAMAKFSNNLNKGLKPLRMRIGINTGPVIVGTLGNDLRVEFKAVGDTVNVASRLENLATPGTTLVTKNTFELTEGFFRFEALKGRKLKGVKEPINTYMVIAPSSRRTRFDVSAEKGLSPFVERRRELELLFDALERAKTGNGQVFSIVSEAGMGKSRLLYEFRKAVINEDVNFFEGKCLSYRKNIAYHPVIDILKSNFNIHDGDKDAIKKNKIISGLEKLGVNSSSILPYMLELLSVRKSGIDRIQISPEAKKNFITEAVKQITLKGSEIRPLILAVEDLHWIDKSSEEYLKNLHESISGARILLVFTYRPEYILSWRRKSYHGQINLNRFSNRESLSMAQGILDSNDLDNDFENLLLGKTEGVPFFIEEFLKLFKDLNIIEKKNNRLHLSKKTKDLTIPSTIHDVIMARVDSLPIGSKEILQAGSAIEREFSYELIKRMINLTEKDLKSHLSVLLDTELLYERGIYPEKTYVFKHALTQEIIYDSILTKAKMKLHDNIGRAIEEICGEDLQEYYGILVDHFSCSENYKKVAKYSKLGGKLAEKKGSVDEAIYYAKKQIQCLEKLPATIEIQNQIIDMRTILGLRMIDINSFHEAQDAIKPIQVNAVKGSYKKRAAQVNTIIGTCEYCVKENFPSAFTHLGKALESSEKSGDIVSIAIASYWIGYLYSLNCEFDKAKYYIDRCLEFNMAVKHDSRISVMKSLLSLFAYFYKGKLKEAFAISKEAIDLSEKNSDIFSKTFAYSIHGISCYGKGLLEEATNNLSKGIKLAESIGHRYWSQAPHYFLGEICFFKKNYSSARYHFNKTITYMEKAKYLPSWLSLNRLALLRIESFDTGVIDIHESNIFDKSTTKVKLYEGWMLNYEAEILLYSRAEHLSEGEDLIKKAIKTNQKNGMKFHLGKDYVLYSKILKKNGNMKGAKENLHKAIDIFQSCNADGWVEKYEKALANI